MITYNHEKYIDKALGAVLAQKCSYNIELIISDDNSSDNTKKIINKYIDVNSENKNITIKYFKHAKNKGVICNFLWALEECKGKYIALCEGDDYWDDPYKLQKQIDILETNLDYVISFHEVEKINSVGELLNQKVLGGKRHRDLRGEELIQGELIPTVSTVFIAEFIRNFPDLPKNLVNGDTFLFAILGQYGKAHFHADIRPAKYRIHNGGVWSGADSKSRIESQILTFETLRNHIQPEFKHLVNNTLFERYLTQITRYDYGTKERIKKYLKLWKFSLENRLLPKMFQSHLTALKNKFKK